MYLVEITFEERTTVYLPQIRRLRFSSWTPMIG
ncbi:hypothetical protein EYZ11_007728 [Aspergillus tanneri]|uniref:Uncharacterized protein n=1 Tax=Aspergillus tanneri TaxID=1220188 RepID=A0A4S3JC99_9EURO|nr:hypothetical protein EYZ11_007728 [Aspergillus tanneri]